MNTQLQKAILQFLSDEFRVDPRHLQDEQELSQELLQRLQDSLDFVLPENSVSHIRTIDDLLLAIKQDDQTDI